MSPWLARRWYDFGYWVSFLSFTFGYSLRVIGRRNLPKSGPALLLSNHQSFLDPVIVGVASHRYLTYLGRDSLFRNRYLGALIESLNAIKIDRDFGKEGLRSTLDALDHGRAVLMFPEGERSHDGEMHPFKPGVSLLVKRLKAPIVPVGIAGAFGALSRFMKTPKFAPLFLAPNEATIAVSVGAPIDPMPLVAMKREEMLQRLHDVVKVEFEKAKRLRRQMRGK
jgi:1-acyl-sn-glycerol-3-phosphate acyltransferase